MMAQYYPEHMQGDEGEPHKARALSSHRHRHALSVSVHV